MHRYILIIALLILPNAGFSSVSDWQWSFSHSRFFGTSTGANDGYDGLDILTPENWSGCLIGFYHQLGVSGWTGTTGFYVNDIRAPLGMTPGTSKTWRIYLWADPDYPSQSIGLSWFPSSGISQEVLDTIEFRMTYIRSAVGVSDAHTVGEYWILNDYPDGGGTGSFTTCHVENGLDGYIFDLTATVIPEPSGLLALVCGLAGISGIAWRRNKRKY
ncbi:hypothetical protein LLG46_05820 [bacterium]|nr:hypothetical protein [bacterium]